VWPESANRALTVVKMRRRPPGALESDVLALLWAANRPITVSDIVGSLSGDLAYNTVQTILTRLHRKGVVEREQLGRTHYYTPVLDEAGIAARRIRDLLDSTKDPAVVFQRFIPTLSRQEGEALRSLLDEHRGSGAAEEAP
jgi:predicted transcriptional regulator